VIRPRRSFVLLAVLVIVTGVLLLVTGLLFVAQAEAAGTVAVHRRGQARGLGWSGVQVVMVRLGEQRERVLDGERLEVEETYTIYEAGNRLGVVRLLPVTPAGELLAPEAGRLDLNHVDAETLSATELVDADTAGAIVAERSRRGGTFQSVAELLAVPDVTPEVLYGPLEDLDVADTAPEQVPGADAPPRGLADVVTVYAHGPALQRDGTRRVHLDVPWSDDLGERCDERFGRGTSAVIRALLDNGAFTEERQLIEALAAQGTPPEDWPALVDTLTAAPGPLHFGRLDLNTASVEALAAMPGVEPEQAQQIVDARGGLSAEDRSTIAWPVMEGIFTAESYAPLADRVTTRSWTYRVRLAAGEVDAEEPDGPLEDAVIWEAVIDLTDPRPRIAYLRDVTLLGTAARLVAGAFAEDLPPDDDLEPGDDVAPEDARSPGGASERPGGTAERSSTAPTTRRADPAPEDAPEDAPDSHGTPSEADGSGSRGRRVGRWVTG
jgi:DNA uptake protein ComE-like DNA-binding protein